MDDVFASTFSIVAQDSASGDLGVAVSSKFLAIGAVTPWGKAGVGAVATQAWINMRYGPLGLAMMEQGLSSQEALESLISGDPQNAQRQVGLVDSRGQAAAHTGQECHDWAGHLIREGYTCQGNLLVGETVLDAMAEVFEGTTGDLWDRLMKTLEAGQEAGGDRRGKQSAALLVVRKEGGYGGTSDRLVDLRVDDHPAPVAELKRLLELYKLHFFSSAPQDLLPLDEAVVSELQQMLKKANCYSGPIAGKYDQATKKAFWKLAGEENLEERWCEGATIDRVVLEFLRDKFET